MSKEKAVRFLTVVVVYCIVYTSVLHTIGVIMAIQWQDADLLDRVAVLRHMDVWRRITHDRIDTFAWR